MCHPNKDRYVPPTNNQTSRKPLFLHILALGGGVAHNGPYSPLRNFEYWDPRNAIANCMASGTQGTAATGFRFRISGARVDVPGAHTNIGVQQNISLKQHPYKTCPRDRLWLVAVADGGCGCGGWLL